MSNTEMVNVSAVSFTRRAALKVGDILKDNPKFMNELESAIYAIEEGKRSSLTVLHNATLALPKDVLEAMPRVGSHPIPGKNAVTDYYTFEGEEGSYYDDLADWLEPEIVKCHEAMKAFAKDGTITPDMPKGFEYPAQNKPDIDRMKTKYAQRRSNLRGMVRKAFRVSQLVDDINALPMVGCRIETIKDKDGNVTGYNQTPKPITLWERGVKEGDLAQSVAWSVSSLLLLAKEIEDEAGESIGLTMLDVAKARGGTFEEITKVVKRERDDKNAKTKAQAAYEVTKPDQFVGNNTVLANYLGMGLTPKEQADIETKVVTWLLTKADDQEIRTFASVAQAYDSLSSKIEPRIRKAMLTASEDAA